MIIKDLLHIARAEKRKFTRKASAQKLAAGLGVATTAAAIGVVTGILIAPKAGKDTRESLKKKAKKSVATVKDAIEDTADAVKNFVDDAGEEVTDAKERTQAKAEPSKKKT